LPMSIYCVLATAPADLRGFWRWPLFWAQAIQVRLPACANLGSWHSRPSRI